MDDKSYLFRLDPAASTSYNLYKASGKGDGTFLDFLLKYDSNKANKGDFSSILGGDENANLLSSLITNSSLSAGSIASAIKTDKQKLSQDPLTSLLSQSSSSTYDLLVSRADEIVTKALNSQNLTTEQKQNLAAKYTELTKGQKS